MSKRFLLSSLEPLDFETNPQTSSFKVIEMYQMNLSSSELAKFYDLQFLINVQNLMQGFCNQKVDPRSSKDRRTFEKEISEGLAPDFLEVFYKKNATNEKRIQNFPALFSDSLGYIQAKHRGFLHFYCKNEKQLLAFLTAFRASMDEKNIAHELAFEDVGDLYIASLLGHKKQFRAPYEFQALFDELVACKRNPLKEYKAVAKYRFNCYYDYVKDYGSIENALLAYFVCLMVLEDSIAFHDDEGLATVKRLVESEYATE